MPPPASARPATSSPRASSGGGGWGGRMWPSPAGRRRGRGPTPGPGAFFSPPCPPGGGRGYRGGAQAVTDTISGTVDFFVSTWPQVVALVKDGRLRCLGIGAPARLAGLPDIPTFAEAGAPYMAVDAWFGLWAPARTPEAIIVRLSDALPRILAEPEMATKLAGLGFTPAPLPAAEFAAFQKAEGARWKALVELTGIRIEG